MTSSLYKYPFLRFIFCPFRVGLASYQKLPFYPASFMLPRETGVTWEHLCRVRSYNDLTMYNRFKDVDAPPPALSFFYAHPPSIFSYIPVNLGCTLVSTTSTTTSTIIHIHFISTNLSEFTWEYLPTSISLPRMKTAVVSNKGESCCMCPPMLMNGGGPATPPHLLRRKRRRWSLLLLRLPVYDIAQGLTTYKTELSLYNVPWIVVSL